MKKIIKRPVLLIMCLLLLLSMTACGSGKSNASDVDRDSVDKAVKNTIAIMQHAEDLGIDHLADAEDEELQEFEAWIKQNGLPIKGNAFKDGYSSYIDAVKGDLGEITKVGDQTDIAADDENITCHIILTGTKAFPDGRPRTATAEIIMTKGGTITSAVINVDRTFNEKLVNAGLNTVLGMGTTFCLLIFISIVIWLMGTIVQNVEKSKNEARRATEQAAEKAARQIVEREEQSRNRQEDLSDDKALIAVISAAIAAYESEESGTAVTPDTFIVRSLRRR